MFSAWVLYCDHGSSCWDRSQLDVGDPWGANYDHCRHRDVKIVVWAGKSSLQLAAGLASHRGAQPKAPLLCHTLPSPPPSSTASRMPVCLAGVVQTRASHRGKGATELLPAGPTLHGRAPLSKQTVLWATSHGHHGTCHYQQCMTGSLPKPKLDQWHEHTALDFSKFLSKGLPRRNTFRELCWIPNTCKYGSVHYI